MADGFTQAEQYLLQLTNRERIRVASQPVANYSVLDNSADGHTDRGFATDTFQHETDLVGFISSYGFEWRAGSYGMWENHQWSSGYPGDLQAQVNVHFNGYMNSASHRANILDPNHELAGMSFEVGEFAGYDPAYYSTQHFAENERAAFLLGAAYSDSILSDHFYSIGEGLGALIVDVRDTVTGAHTILNTDVTGGFQLELGSGKFQVELINPATGLHTAPQSITLADLNRQLNFESPSFLTPSEPIPITGRTFNGGNKADALTGTSADDLIRGNGGGDRLNGGAGQDQIWGGAGADVFYLVPGGGHDIVMDWSHAQGDRLNVHDVGLATFADVQACTKPTTNGALITAPSGDQILLAGVQASSLVSRDFLF